MPASRSSTKTARMTTSPAPPPRLTTVFTPAPNCLTFTDVGTIFKGNYYHMCDPYYTTGLWTACYPPSFAGVWTVKSKSSPSYYSPGICPVGYTIESEWIASYNSYFSLTTETGGRCCLSGWTPAPSADYCTNTISQTTVTAPAINIRWSPPDMSLFNPDFPGMANAAELGPTITSTMKSASIDAATSTTGPKTGAVSKTSAHSGPVATLYVTQMANATSSSGTSKGLLTVAKASIGIAVFLLVLAIAAGLVFCFMRRRRRSRNFLPELNYSTRKGKANDNAREHFEMDANTSPGRHSLEDDYRYPHSDGLRPGVAELPSRRSIIVELEAPR